jgi:hypothetical protein
MSAVQPNTSSTDTIHIYYAQSRARSSYTFRLFLGIAGLLIIALIVIRPLNLVVLWPFFSVCLVFWISQRSRQRPTYLRLSAQELEYQRPDIHIVTSWANVKALTSTVFGPSLLLYQPAARENHLRMGTGAFLADFADREIPLWAFDYAELSALMTDIRRFAPQIARGIASETKPS